MKKFIKDIRKYFAFSVYSAKCDLKSEVANSRLSVLWWGLDPLLFMLVYTFVVKVVFVRGGADYPVFVFTGLTIWNFFNKYITSSVKIVSANKGIISKVYIPKYILLLEKMFVLLFKFLISFILVIILMFVFKVNFTLSMFHAIPLIIILIIFNFSISLFLLHFGVFVEDLSNLIRPILRLMFYVSGILYSIPESLSSSYSWILLYFNPIALIVNDFRSALLYNNTPHYFLLFIWLLISILLCFAGIRIIQKYENSYTKVV